MIRNYKTCFLRPNSLKGLLIFFQLLLKHFQLLWGCLNFRTWMKRVWDMCKTFKVSPSTPDTSSSSLYESFEMKQVIKDRATLVNIVNGEHQKPINVSSWRLSEDCFFIIILPHISLIFLHLSSFYNIFYYNSFT